MSLLVISPCYAPDTSFAAQMVATARRFGLEPLLYGVGRTIHPHCSDAQGPHMLELLSGRTERYVLSVDAFDVAFLTGEDEILEKFSTFPTRFVVSTELSGCAGLVKTKTKIHQMCLAAGGLSPQLNIGGWVGEREYVIHCFNEAERLYKNNPEDPAYNYDNHYQWLCMMKAWGGAEFDLDWKSVIFQSMDQSPTVWEGKRIKNTVTGTMPCLIHYNGDKTYAAFRKAAAELLV